MLYKNIKTGVEMHFASKISSPDWIPVETKEEAKAPKEAPTVEPPKAEPINEEPLKEEPKAAAKKSKSAPKTKRAKK